jgi:hypothetical protein
MSPLTSRCACPGLVKVSLVLDSEDSLGTYPRAEALRAPESLFPGVTPELLRPTFFKYGPHLKETGGEVSSPPVPYALNCHVLLSDSRAGTERYSPSGVLLTSAVPAVL